MEGSNSKNMVEKTLRCICIGMSNDDESEGSLREGTKTSEEGGLRDRMILDGASTSSREPG